MAPSNCSLSISFGAFHTASPLSRPLPLVLRDIESKGCKSTNFLPYPPPSANTDSPGPVPGLSICRTSDRSYASFSPCSLPNKLQASLSLHCMYEAVWLVWYGNNNTDIVCWLPPPFCMWIFTASFLLSFAAHLLCVCIYVCVCVCWNSVCATANCWLQAYYFKMSPAPALIPGFFREG